MTNSDPTPTDGAPESDEPASARKSRRKWPWILLVLGLAATLTYSAWLPRAVELLSPAAARSFGYRLRMTHVARCDLGGIEIHGFALENKAKTGVLRRVQAKSIAVTYGWGLLQGQLEELHSAAADGVRVDLAPQLGTTDAAEPDAPPSDWLEPFHSLPVVEITDVLIRIHSDGEETQHEVQALTVDEQGAIHITASTAERQLAATANWGGQNLANLQLEVDGERLLQDTSVDLSKAYIGEYGILASIPIGAGSQGVSAQLTNDGIRWQADWNGLDLEVLWARLPIEFELDLKGTLNLASTGELKWEAPTAAQVALQFDGDALQYMGLEIPKATGQLSLLDGIVEIPRLDVRLTEGNFALIESASFPLSDLDPEHLLSTAQAKLSVVVEDSRPLLNAFGSEEARARKLVNHRIALDATLDGRALIVQELGLTSDAGNVRLSSGRVELGAQNQIRVDAAGQARLHDLAAIGQLFGRADWAGSLGGMLRLEGTYPKLGGELELSGTDVEIEGIALGQLDLVLRTEEPGADIEVSRLRIASPQGELNGRLWIAPGAQPEVRVTELSAQRRGEQLALTAPAAIRFGVGEGSFDPFRFAGTAGMIDCQGSWSASDFDLTLDVRELNPNLLNTLEVDAPLTMAGAELRLVVLSRAGKLEFQSEGSIAGWLPPHWPEPIDMRWNVAHKDGHLDIQAFEALQADQTLFGLRGACPIEFGGAPVFGTEPLELNLETHMPLGLLQEGAIGTLHLGGEIGGTWRALSGAIDVVGRDLRLAPEWHPEGLESGSIQGQVRLNDQLTLENASLQFGDWIDASINLRADLPLDVPRWMESYESAIDASEFESRLDVAALDVERLRPILTSLSESFEILREGELSGSLQMTGPLGAPELNGNVTLVDGRVRPGGGLPPVEALGAELQLERTRVLVREVRGTLGAAPFLIEGEVLFADGSPEMNLSLEGDDLLLLRNPDARVRANTELRVHGALEQLKIQGKLELTTGSYSPQLDFLNLRAGPQGSTAKGFQLFTFREPPLRDMAFDIELTALDSFAIHNSILNGSILPVLHLGGTGLLPILNGTVYMEPTRLKLPVAQLDIIGGTLRFLEENPFVPQLDIQGQTRQLGYDIRADISGAYDDPELLLSSTPPLSQEDLFLLLVTGRLPDDPNRTNLLSTANTVALYLARDAVARWFADDGPLNEDSLVERLEFAIGQDVSKNGSETFEVAVRVTDRMGKPQATKNARHAYLVAERDKYEDYNYGIRWVFRFRR